MSKRTGRRNGVKLPVAIILGFMPLAGKMISDVRSGGFSALGSSVSAIVPYDPVSRRVTFANLGLGLWPIIAGILVHKIVGGYFGINRALGNMGLPWVRI
jgi:nitrate reductase NapE component